MPSPASASLQVMKHKPLVIGGIVLAVLLAAVAGAQDAPAEPGEAETPSRMGQVVRPYNLLDDLSPEQERQLRLIRGEYLATVAEARRVEREKSLAILTDEQAERLAEIEAERREEAARRRAERREQQDRQDDPE
jgi:Spy/CpxP family protein refolding chaperone